MRYTGDPVAGDAGVPAMRDLNRKRVVVTAFVAAHLVAVSFESTGAQDSESANCVTTCQALYSGSVAPDMRIMSPATTPVAVPVPDVPTIESGFVGDLLVNTETDPLCTVTVSLLRDTRRATSATLVSVLFAEGRPPRDRGCSRKTWGHQRQQERRTGCARRRQCQAIPARVQDRVLRRTEVG